MVLVLRKALGNINQKLGCVEKVFFMVSSKYKHRYALSIALLFSVPSERNGNDGKFMRLLAIL